MISGGDQLSLTILSVGTGLLFGLIWDLLQPCCKKRVITFFLDVFFFLVLGIWNFLFLLYWCEGHVRFYIFCLEGLGFCIYRLALHPVTVWIQTGVLWVVKLIFKPFRWLFRLLSAPIVSILRKLGGNLKKSLKFLWCGVYNQYIFPLRHRKRKGETVPDEKESDEEKN